MVSRTESHVIRTRDARRTGARIRAQGGTVKRATAIKTPFVRSVVVEISPWSDPIDFGDLRSEIIGHYHIPNCPDITGLEETYFLDLFEPDRTGLCHDHAAPIAALGVNIVSYNYTSISGIGVARFELPINGPGPLEIAAAIVKSPFSVDPWIVFNDDTIEASSLPFGNLPLAPSLLPRVEVACFGDDGIGIVRRICACLKRVNINIESFKLATALGRFDSIATVTIRDRDDFLALDQAIASQLSDLNPTISPVDSTANGGFVMNVELCSVGSPISTIVSLEKAASNTSGISMANARLAVESRHNSAIEYHLFAVDVIGQSEAELDKAKNEIKRKFPFVDPFFAASAKPAFPVYGQCGFAYGDTIVRAEGVTANKIFD